MPWLQVVEAGLVEDEPKSDVMAKQDQHDKEENASEGDRKARAPTSQHAYAKIKQEARDHGMTTVFTKEDGT